MAINASLVHKSVPFILTVPCDLTSSHHIPPSPFYLTCELVGLLLSDSAIVTLNIQARVHEAQKFAVTTKPFLLQCQPAAIMLTLRNMPSCTETKGAAVNPYLVYHRERVWFQPTSLGVWRPN